MGYITDRFTITKREKSPEGYLIVKDSRLARIGTLSYVAAELPNIAGMPSSVSLSDVIRVHRGKDQLFDDDTMESFRYKPMTMQHPENLVDPKNVKSESIGFSRDDVRPEGDHLIATLSITDEEAIKAVEGGVNELSLGYTADIHWHPGIDEHGQPYDAVQRNIRGNHIAIVPRGRCGSTCKISDEQTTNRGNIMPDPQIILDGISYECPAQTAQAFDKVIKAQEKVISILKDEAEELKKEIEDTEEEMKDGAEKAEKEKDELQAKLDEAESSKVKDSDLDALVEERANLVSSAKSVLKDFNPSGLSNADIKKSVVKDVCGVDVSKKSADYINARFDALIESASGKSSIADVMKGHAGVSVTTAMSLSERKRQERIDANKQKRRGA